MFSSVFFISPLYFMVFKLTPSQRSGVDEWSKTLVAAEGHQTFKSLGVSTITVAVFSFAQLFGLQVIQAKRFARST